MILNVHPEDLRRVLEAARIPIRERLKLGTADATCPADDADAVAFARVLLAFRDAADSEGSA